jgi:competence protein ComFC
VCTSCRKQTALKYVWVANEYDGLPKQLVYQLKFQNAKAAVAPMVRMMDETLPFLPADTIIVHVPTATARYRQRGYDQAELLAKQLAKQRGLPHATLLARIGQSRQVGATRSERLKQLQGNYRPVKPYLIAGAHILLVDDILTTGSTLEAVARTLNEAGAKRVDAITFAQKQ